MTDKNLADECERLANKLAALIEVSPGPGTLLEAMNVLDRATAALRASAAPQLAENGFDVDLFTLCRRTYIRRVFPEIGERAIVSIANEAASAAAQAVAAGQAARAKRDAEIVLSLTGMDAGAMADEIEKDAAG